MKKLLLVCDDEIGPRMAGPGIRYFHFARELAKRFDVALVVPVRPDDPVGEVVVLRAADWQGRRFRSLVARHDVVVARALRPWSMAAIAAEDVQVVYDLYDPFLVGNLAFHAGEAVSARYRRAAFLAPTLLQEIALLTGNSFVCASERQRDLFIGMLGALGRIDPDAAVEDPSFRDLIEVVPFGLENDPPLATKRVLKGVVPGIRDDDRVLLWGGGIWNWFDPLTPIRAVHALSRKRDDVKLFFLGVEHPNAAIQQLAMTNRAVELARELGVYDRFVFFNFGWVPYAERANYLLESDLGLSAHLETLETRFAFRTRLLDYLWASLPTVTTEGDVLAELVADRNLGRTVRPGSVEDWTQAIEELLDDEGEYARIRTNIEQVRGGFTWAHVVEPLVRLAGLEGRAVERGRALATTTARYGATALQTVLLRRGVVGGAREVYRALRRSPVP